MPYFGHFRGLQVKSVHFVADGVNDSLLYALLQKQSLKGVTKCLSRDLQVKGLYLSVQIVLLQKRSRNLIQADRFCT